MEFGRDALLRDEGHKLAIGLPEMMISCTHFGVQCECLWYVALTAFSDAVNALHLYLCDFCSAQMGTAFVVL